VLEALAVAVLPAGVDGAALSALATGWEELLEPEMDEAGLLRYAQGRGGALFALAGRLAGVDRAVLAPAGEGWALADLALHAGDETLVDRARALARVRLDGAADADWPAPARMLGALVHLARRDLALRPGERPARGAPRRVARMLWHRLSGR
jgi:phytoene synthase